MLWPNTKSCIAIYIDHLIFLTLKDSLRCEYGALISKLVQSTTFPLTSQTVLKLWLVLSSMTWVPKIARRKTIRQEAFRSIVSSISPSHLLFRNAAMTSASFNRNKTGDKG